MALGGLVVATIPHFLALGRDRYNAAFGDGEDGGGGAKSKIGQPLRTSKSRMISQSREDLLCLKRRSRFTGSCPERCEKSPRTQIIPGRDLGRRKPKSFRRASRVFLFTTPQRLSAVTLLSQKVRFHRADRIEDLGEFSGKADRQLGTREINGKKADGFQIDMKKMSPDGSGGVAEVWLDPSSSLPVFVRYEYRGLDNSTTVEIRDIQWNIDLDPKLFDPTPPKGYTDITPKPPDLKDQIRDIVVSLKIYAQASGGRYPANRVDYLDTTDDLCRLLGLREWPDGRRRGTPGRLPRRWRDSSRLGISKLTTPTPPTTARRSGLATRTRCCSVGSSTTVGTRSSSATCQRDRRSGSTPYVGSEVDGRAASRSRVGAGDSLTVAIVLPDHTLEHERGRADARLPGENNSLEDGLCRPRIDGESRVNGRVEFEGPLLGQAQKLIILVEIGLSSQLGLGRYLSPGATEQGRQNGPRYFPPPKAPRRCCGAPSIAGPVCTSRAGSVACSSEQSPVALPRLPFQLTEYFSRSASNRANARKFKQREKSSMYSETLMSGCGNGNFFRRRPGSPLATRRASARTCLGLGNSSQRATGIGSGVFPLDSRPQGELPADQTGARLPSCARGQRQLPRRDTLPQTRPGEPRRNEHPAKEILQSRCTIKRSQGNNSTARPYFLGETFGGNPASHENQPIAAEQRSSWASAVASARRYAATALGQTAHR